MKYTIKTNTGSYVATVHDKSEAERKIAQYDKLKSDEGPHYFEVEGGDDFEPISESGLDLIDSAAREGFAIAPGDALRLVGEVRRLRTIESNHRTFEQRVAEAEAEIREWPMWKRVAANRVFLGEGESQSQTTEYRSVSLTREDARQIAAWISAAFHIVWPDGMTDGQAAKMESWIKALHGGG